MRSDPDSYDSNSCNSDRGAGASGALVLWSGGLDSTTLLAIASDEGFEPTALIFSYGQRHAVEVECACREAERLSVPYRLAEIDLRAVGGSALTSEEIDVPVDRSLERFPSAGIPLTYVPARNTIFLSYALAWSEVLGVADIFIGVNAVDYSGYPDCRPEYIDAFVRMANLACRSTTQDGVTLKIHTPLIDKSKAEIIQWGTRLGVDYSRTWSCYAPEWRVCASEKDAVALACGRCDSCLLRRQGFVEAGMADPTRYR